MARIFTILLLFVSVFSYSQLTFSTDFIAMYLWNQETQEYSSAIYEEEKYAFFEFNKEMTFMRFTTNKVKTSYILSDLKYDKDTEQYTFNAISDSGYEVIMILTLKAKQANIRYVMELDEQILLLEYTLKYYWYDKE